MERRSIDRPCRIETRADGGRVLTGYAAVYYRADDPGTQFTLWRGAVERVGTVAFDRAIRERQDVRGLANHAASQLLGRVPAGTLRLSSDDVGLRYEIDLPDTQLGKDIQVSIERGDMTGSSFAFSPTKVQWTIEGDTEVRTLLDVDLFDVGPVTYPAYAATTAGIRADEGAADAKAEHEAWAADRRRGQGMAEAIAVRTRLASL